MKIPKLNYYLLFILFCLLNTSYSTNAQQVIKKRDGTILSCKIVLITEDFISYASDISVEKLERSEIESISTYVLSKSFYLQNFGLRKPYPVTDLYLKDELLFQDDFAYQGFHIKRLGVKVVAISDDSVLFVQNFDSRYAMDKIAIINLRNFDFSFFGDDKLTNLGSVKKDLVQVKDSVYRGEIVKWDNYGVIIKYSLFDSFASVFIPYLEINAIKLKDEEVVFPIKDVPIPKVRKAYPRWSISAGAKLVGNVNYSGSTTPVLDPSFRESGGPKLYRLNTFILKTQLDINKSWDIQLNYTWMWSNQVLFESTNTSNAGRTYAATAYKMRAHRYDIGAGYTWNNIRLGARANLVSTRSTFHWQQVTYGFSSSAAIKGVEGVVISRPKLGYGSTISYLFKIGKTWQIEPELSADVFYIDFDRLYDVVNTNNTTKFGTHGANMGDYEQFKAAYASQQTDWVVTSLNIFVRKYLFKKSN